MGSLVFEKNRKWDMTLIMLHRSRTLAIQLTSASANLQIKQPSNERFLSEIYSNNFSLFADYLSLKALSTIRSSPENTYKLTSQFEKCARQACNSQAGREQSSPDILDPLQWLVVLALSHPSAQ